MGEIRVRCVKLAKKGLVKGVEIGKNNCVWAKWAFIVHKAIICISSRRTIVGTLNEDRSPRRNHTPRL